MVSPSSIFAAMSDARPGRFYSIDELAALLHVADKTGLHEQLRAMARAPDIHSCYRLLQGSSADFYQRVSFAPDSTFCAPCETKVS